MINKKNDIVWYHPNSEDYKDDPYAMYCSNTGFYVKQNTDSGLQPVLNKPGFWQAAAEIGTFNYTACKNCEVFDWKDRYGRKTLYKPNCNGECLSTKQYKTINECPDSYSCGGVNIDNKVMFISEYGWYFDDMSCYIKDYKSINGSCSKCKCKEEKDSNISIRNIVEASRTITKGIDIYECLGFCTAAKLDYNNDGYIDIEDIVSMIDCIQNDNCKLDYICGVNT